MTARILILILLFALQLIGLFNQDAEVLRYGMQLVRLMAPFYLISVANHIFRSVLNGAGLSRFTMLATLGGYVLSRRACLLLHGGNSAPFLRSSWVIRWAGRYAAAL